MRSSRPGVGRLVRGQIAPFGAVWFPNGGERQVGNLGAEVAEYFDDAVELSPGDVVMDVGANIGTFAMRAASVTRGLRFLCIEPIPALFESLRRNFAEHPLLAGTDHTLHNVGLTFTGDVTEADFVYFKRLPCDTTRHIDQKRAQFDRFFANAGKSTSDGIARALGAGMGRPLGRAAAAVIADLPRGAVGRWMSDLVTGAVQVRCALATADQILEDAGVTAIDLLKIDVEGAELDVLRGFSPTFWPRVRQIVLEGHDENGRLDAIRTLLADHWGDGHVDVCIPESAKKTGLDNFLLSAKRRRVDPASSPELRVAV